MKNDPLLNPSVFPVSSRGCWFSLAIRDTGHGKIHRPQGPGLYLRNHHGSSLNQREFCRIDLLRGGSPLEISSNIEPGLLRLTPASGPGIAELILLPPGHLRVRVSGGISLKLSVLPAGANVAYAFSDTLLALNVRTTRQRFQVESLEGSQLLDSPWGEIACEKIEVTLLPTSTGTGEWAIDSYTSTWQPPARLSFEQEATRLSDSFTSFLQGQNTVPPAFEETQKKAALTNWSCLVSPCGKFEREAMLMSKGWMDQVWSWDNCFNAMALAAGMPELALDQLMTVIDRQDSFGAYPDACNDVHEHYNFSKPPVWGIAIDELRRVNPGFFSPERLRPVYDSVVRNTDWWLENRRLPGQPLAYYLHGNDSGWDNSTQFDQGVPLIAPDLNTFLICQLRSLAALARDSDLPSDAERFEAQAGDLTEAVLGDLWNGEKFVGILQGRPIESQSLIPHMPILLGTALPGEIRQSLIDGIRSHLTPWGPATEHPESPKYTADGYWRGPIWGPSTALLVIGLERCGETVLAADIAHRFATLCQTSGFAENFDALSGAPLRDPAYSWTASVFLQLAGRLSSDDT